MFARLFIALAVAFLLQRAFEIHLHDRRLRGRRPHWTALAMVLVHVSFVVASVGEVLWRDEPPASPVSVAGALLLLAGIVLRRWVIRTLGPLWSIDVDLENHHQLITSGPFRWCRHPNYMAILLETAGFCLVPGAFITLAVAVPTYALVLLFRIAHEERALIARFGDEYRRYMHRTFRLLPVGQLASAARR